MSVCDLRWGIDTSDLEDHDSSRKVLDVCLSEIDRCRPYMIALLGYRYGWIPEEGLIADTVADKGGFVLKNKEISITALEIEYSILSGLGDVEHTLFYFREIDGPMGEIYQAEDEIHRQKLDELKAKILAIPNAHIRTYHVDMLHPEQSMRAFSAMVVQDLYGAMKQEWEANAALDHYAIDQKRQWEFLEEKSVQFLSRETLLEACLSAVLGGRDLLIHGETGSGKSTLISRLGSTLFGRGFDVVPVYCGYTHQTSTGFDILQYLVYETERRLGIESHFSEQSHKKAPGLSEWLTYMQALFEAYEASSQKDLIFLIDGVDQLIWDAVAENRAFLPEGHFQHVHFCLSMVTAHSMPFETQIAVEGLNPEERRQVITGIMRSKHRELSANVIDRILELPNANIPLYLSLVVQRLLMMDYGDFQKMATVGNGMAAITRYQLSLIDECPEALEDLSNYIIKCASTQIGGEPTKLMGIFLAISRHGLRLSDLENLVSALRDPRTGERLQLNTVDAIAFLQYMGEAFLFRNDGRVDFSHKCFREGIRKIVPQPEPLHHLIASWLRHLPASDEVRTQELGWHLIQSGDKRQIIDLVALEEDNQPLLKAMARDLAEKAAEDGGTWLEESLKAAAEVPFFLRYSGFICYNVFYELTNDKKGLELRRRIVKTTFNIEEARLGKKMSYGYQWDSTVCMDRLASIEREYGNSAHMAKAEECSLISLTRREVLLQELEKLDTDQKRMDFLLSNMEEQGKGLSQRPSSQQLQELISLMRIEVLRGICVAHEDVARALEASYPESAAEALRHLESSLTVRTQLFNEGGKKGENFIDSSSDETYELARIHEHIGKANEVLGGSFAHEAEKHYRQAVAVSEDAVRRNPSMLHILGLSECSRSLAQFLFNLDSERAKEAIAIAKKCLALTESAYQKSRTADCQLELSLVYNLCGDLYRGIQEEETAHDYYAKMNALTKGLKGKTKSVASIHAAVVAGIKEAESAGRLSPEEMCSYFHSTYLQAKALTQSTGSEEAYHRLDAVYEALIHVIENSDFGREIVGKRAITEVKCARLDASMQREDVPLSKRKRAVVAYNKLSEEIQELNLPDDAAWPQEWIELLEGVDIRRDILTAMPAERAYHLSKKSYLMTCDIVQMEDTPSNEDALAVSLTKFSQICMQIDLKEFKAVNHKLFQLASHLFQKTGNQKYANMLLMAQMGESIISGRESEFLNQFMPELARRGGKDRQDTTATADAGKRETTGRTSAQTEPHRRNEKELRDLFRSMREKTSSQETEPNQQQEDLLQRINALEKELRSLSGIRGLFRRKKVKMELKQLKEELRKVQEHC